VLKKSFQKKLSAGYFKLDKEKVKYFIKPSDDFLVKIELKFC